MIDREREHSIRIATLERRVVTLTDEMRRVWVKIIELEEAKK